MNGFHTSSALVIQCYRFDRLTVAANTNHLNTSECYDYQLHCKKTHHTSFSAHLTSAVQVRGGCMHTHTESPPPLQITDDCCFAQCAKKEQITVTGQSSGVETTVEARHTERCLGRIKVTVVFLFVFQPLLY